MAVPEHPSVSAPLDERTLATIADGLACADPAAFLPVRRRSSLGADRLHDRRTRPG